MKCPFCGFEESKVIDSRPTDEGSRIRRRRECLSCTKRFTTYEMVESVPLIVVKKDGSREMFDRSKLMSGMVRACQKRQVSVQVLESAVSEIEARLQNSMDREIPTDRIGEYAMEALKEIDEVAYIRFASVYRQFKDISSFRAEISKLLDK
jgi:transcriptional repressor NrdR